MTAPNALVPTTPLVPTVADLSEYEADVGDISVMDFALVKQPASTGKKLRYIPDRADEDEEENIDEVVGVIVHVQRYRQYYAKAWEPGSSDPPDCFAADNREGIGNNGEGHGRHACESCPLSVWGAGDEPPVCNERILIYVHPEGELLPYQLDLPPSALGVSQRYAKRVRRNNLRPHQVITRFTLDTSGNYPRIKMEQVGLVGEEQAELVEAYKTFIGPAIERGLRAQIAYRERLLEEAGSA